MEWDEYSAQVKIFGELPEGILAEKVDVGIDRTSNIRWLIKNCLGKEGECKLEGRNPLACRVFPLFTSELITNRGEACPKTEEIAKCEDIKKGIERIKKVFDL